MVPPSSDQVSRVWPYSGTRAALVVFTYGILTLFDWPSHAIRLTTQVLKAIHTPEGFLLPVCPLPRSLATTNGISFDVSSSPYLDVSVQAVPFLHLWIQYRMTGLAPGRVSPFGYPRVKCLLSANRGFSQIAASFIGSQCQGIPLALFLA